MPLPCPKNSDESEDLGNVKTIGDLVLSFDHKRSLQANVLIIRSELKLRGNVCKPGRIKNGSCNLH